MIRVGLLLILAGLMMACGRDFRTVKKVDLQRFMGDWYVIAILPNFIEKNAYNGIESYQLNPDGTIGVTYTFFKGGPQGKKKVMHPLGKVFDRQSNAHWKMRLIKPFWSDYLIVDLAPDYRYTVIGVPNRKFVWIMSRTPELTDEDYSAIIKRLAAMGYKTDKIMKIPQVW